MSKIDPKVILISQFPLPYSNIGSWTTMYKNYFNDQHLIDQIVCPSPSERFPNVNYKIVENSLVDKVKRKASKNRYLSYLKALEELIEREGKYIIQLVDNFGLATELENFLVNNKLRDNCYVQFFYHGFAPFYGNFQSRGFFEFIDEMVVLTNACYNEHKSYYNILPCMFSILPNGVDTSKFYIVSEDEKLALKKKHFVEGKYVFLWCSQDRPKKGLDLILKAWKLVRQDYKNAELWVIGSDKQLVIDGVKFLGRIPNNSLPEYYQTADCYLFPTLCHEGFGLSLVEALHCGNYCIASALGGVPEVLDYGCYGRLINNPHFIEEWVEAIKSVLEENYKQPTKISKEMYSSSMWNKNMNRIISKAKQLI